MFLRTVKEGITENVAIPDGYIKLDITKLKRGVSPVGDAEIDLELADFKEFGKIAVPPSNIVIIFDYDKDEEGKVRIKSKLSFDANDAAKYYIVDNKGTTFDTIRPLHISSNEWVKLCHNWK